MIPCPRSEGLNRAGFFSALRESLGDVVITSYSIHYTKLYEIFGTQIFSRASSSLCMKGIHMRRFTICLILILAVPSAFGVDLFAHRAGICSIEPSKTMMPWVIIHDMENSVNNGVYQIQVIGRVITSYSIHYTKLYERYIRRQRQRPGISVRCGKRHYRKRSSLFSG